MSRQLDEFELLQAALFALERALAPLGVKAKTIDLVSRDSFTPYQTAAERLLTGLKTTPSFAIMYRATMGEPQKLPPGVECELMGVRFRSAPERA